MLDVASARVGSHVRAYPWVARAYIPPAATAAPQSRVQVLIYRTAGPPHLEAREGRPHGRHGVRHFSQLPLAAPLALVSEANKAVEAMPELCRHGRDGPCGGQSCRRAEVGSLAGTAQTDLSAWPLWCRERKEASRGAGAEPPGRPSCCLGEGLSKFCPCLAMLHMFVAVFPLSKPL